MPKARPRRNRQSQYPEDVTWFLIYGRDYTGLLNRSEWPDKTVTDRVKRAWGALKYRATKLHQADTDRWLEFTGKHSEPEQRDIRRPWAEWVVELLPTYGPRLPTGHPELRNEDRSNEPPRLIQPDGYETSTEYLKRNDLLSNREKEFLAGGK